MDNRRDINAPRYYPWVTICSTEKLIYRLDSALAELDFEYPTIKSLRTLNNSAIVQKVCTITIGN